MNVSLTPELEEFVNLKVQSGRYSTVSEVIREGLRLLERQENTLPSFTNQAELEALLRAGIKSMENGDTVDGKEAFEKLRKKGLSDRRSGRIKNRPVQCRNESGG